MNKELRKILFITDDFDDDHWEYMIEDCKDGNYFYNDEDNWLNFEFTLSKDFNIKDPEYFDAILIDYGLVGNEMNMKNIERFYNRGIQLAWVGGMSHHYLISDLKKLFPDYLFAPLLMVTTIGDDDILYLLYNLFDKESPDIEDETIKTIKDLGIDLEESINSFVVLIKIRKYCESFDVATVEELAPKFMEATKDEMKKVEKEITKEIHEMIKNANKKADRELKELLSKKKGGK